MSIELALDDIASCQHRQLILDRLNQCKQSSIAPFDLLNALLYRIVQSDTNSVEVSNYVFAVGLFCTLARSWSSAAERHIDKIVRALHCVQRDYEANELKWALFSSCSRLVTLSKPEHASSLHSEMIALLLPIVQTRAELRDEEVMLLIKAIQYVDQIVCFLPELLCESSSTPALFSYIFNLISNSEHSELTRVAAQCSSRFIELTIADFTHPGLHLVEPIWFNDANDDNKIDESQRQELEKQLLAFKLYDVSAAAKSLTGSREFELDINMLYFLALLAKSQDPENCCVAGIYRYCYNEILNLIDSPAVRRKKSLRNQVSQMMNLLGSLISLLSKESMSAVFGDIQILFKELNSRNLLLASIRGSLHHCFSRYLLSNPSTDDPNLESTISFCLDNLANPIVTSDCVFIARLNQKLLSSIAEKVRDVICLALEDRRQETIEHGLEAAGRIACYLFNSDQRIVTDLVTAVNDLLDKNPSPIALLSAVRLITHTTCEPDQIARTLSKLIDLALLRSCFDASADDGTDCGSELQIASLLALKTVFTCGIISGELLSDQEGFVNDLVNELVLAPCIFEDEVEIRLLALDVIGAVAERYTIFDWKQIMYLLTTVGKEADIGRILDGGPLQDLINTISTLFKQ